MPGTLRILAVGPRAFTSLVRHALVDRRPLSLSVAVSYWDLCSLVLRETEQVSVAILESSISEFELRDGGGSNARSSTDIENSVAPRMSRG